MKKKKSVLDAELPKTDPRVKLLVAKMKKESYRQDAIIEILHAAQNSYGYLPMNVLAFITREMKIPPSRVYSTVTFYHFFTLKPKGEHTCLICTGTACYVKGAQAIVDQVEKDFNVKVGEVTADGKLGLQVARCVGACGLAPAVVIDEEVAPRAKAEDIKHILRQKMGALQ